MTTPRLTLHVRAKPMRAAATLRRYMAMRGYVPIAPRSDDIPSVVFVLSSIPSGSPFTAIRPEPAEQCDDHLGGFLSQELRSVAYTVVLGGDVVAVRCWEAGVQQSQFGRVADRIVEEADVPWAQKIVAGANPEDVLGTLGLHSLGDEGPDGKSITVGFQARGRGATDASLLLDPLLECPRCQEPMVQRKARHGLFFGCVRYPDCDGVLSEKQAAEARAKRVGGA